MRELRPQTCSSWLARCNELGASAPAVHSGLSCSARCAGAPRPRRTSAVVPWRVSRVRGSTHATCGCFADAHSDTVQRIARRCHEWTWDSVQCRATMLWACGQRRCIACTLWTDRTCVRAVFCEIWVTLLRAGPCSTRVEISRGKRGRSLRGRSRDSRSRLALGRHSAHDLDTRE